MERVEGEVVVGKDEVSEGYEEIRGSKLFTTDLLRSHQSAKLTFRIFFSESSFKCIRYIQTIFLSDTTKLIFNNFVYNSNLEF